MTTMSAESSTVPPNKSKPRSHAYPKTVMCVTSTGTKLKLGSKVLPSKTKNQKGCLITTKNRCPRLRTFPKKKTSLSC